MKLRQNYGGTLKSKSKKNTMKIRKHGTIKPKNKTPLKTPLKRSLKRSLKRTKKTQNKPKMSPIENPEKKQETKREKIGLILCHSQDDVEGKFQSKESYQSWFKDTTEDFEGEEDIDESYESSKEYFENNSKTNNTFFKNTLNITRQITNDVYEKSDIPENLMSPSMDTFSLQGIIEKISGKKYVDIVVLMYCPLNIFWGDLRGNSHKEFSTYEKKIERNLKKIASILQKSGEIFIPDTTLLHKSSQEKEKYIESIRKYEKKTDFFDNTNNFIRWKLSLWFGKPTIVGDENMCGLLWKV